MERLTVKSEIIIGYSLKALCQFNREGTIDDEESCGEHCTGKCEECAVRKAINKLAEYENAEEQGLRGDSDE